MSYSIFDFIKLLGSLALFLYGMKMMSEGIQKLAGERMRSILGGMTRNRFFGIMTGLLITSVVQSSSATTVMTVSFVNAGLLGLSQAFSVIMGANIGTTTTAWLISLLGFKVHIAVISLPLIGLVFPLMFSKRASLNYTAESFIGFALLFMGLDFLKNSVPDLKTNPEMFSFLQGFTDMGYGSVFIFLALGSVLTIVMQSSSATMALTLVMCNNGWIGLTEGAALVLGENIGTTITANLAGLVGNVNAKRAALSHTVFNVLGVIWMLIFFYKYLDLIDYILIKIGLNSAYINSESIPYSLSVFHTSFNIINTMLWVWFAAFIIAITKFIIKDKKKEDENKSIEYLGTGFMQLPELSLLEAKNLSMKYCDISKRMFGFVKDYLKEKDEKESNRIYERIQKYEEIIDKIEQEITVFLINVSNKEVSVTAKEKIRRMRILSIEVEKIGDTCNKMSVLIKNIKSETIEFSANQMEHIEQMFLLVEESFSIMFECINSENKELIEKATAMEDRINAYRDLIRDELYEHLDKSDKNFKTGFFANKLCTSCEKIADNIFNIDEAILGVNVE